MPKQPLDLRFPLKGFDENWAFGAQPEDTTPECLNVRPYDVLGQRLRGGQRPGLSKFIDTQVNGTTPIQRLGLLVQASDEGVASSHTETFTAADGTFLARFPSTWGHYKAPQFIAEDFFQIPITLDANSPDILSNEIHIPTTKSFITDHVYLGGAIDPTDTPTIEVDFRVANEAIFTILYRINETLNGDCQGVRFYIVGPTWFAVHVDGTAGGGEVEDYNDWYNPGEAYTVFATTKAVKLVVATNGSVGLYIDDVLKHTFDPRATGVGNAGVGFETWGDGADFDWYVDNFKITGTGTPPLSYRKPTLIAVSGGDIYTGSPLAGLSLATGGDDALVTATDDVKMAAVLSKMYFADGTNYKVYEVDTDTVSTWKATAGTLPVGSDQSQVSITAATPATPSFTVAEDYSFLEADDYLLVEGSTGNDGFYTVASTSGTGPTVITVNETIPDGTADGTLQWQNRACRIIASYRGRAVLAGLITDPQNWFMSKAGDPLDFDYGATPSATIAVAGNNSDAGRCPDIITCLAALSDDLLVIGGDHTVWLMRGDPAAGGRLDNISQQTGIAGPDAWCLDPNGTFYFFGNGQFWRMVPGQLPVSISSGRLDRVFNAIDLAENTVKLVWDQTHRGVKINVIPSAEGPTRHYWWDSRTDGFWPEEYPDAMGPSAVFPYDADNPNDRALLIGGWDGYIRYEDDSSVTDDGTTIYSNVCFGPVTPGGPHANVRVSRTITILATDSDPVALKMYAAQSPQEVVAATTPVWSQVVTAYNRYGIPRIGGNSVMFELENSSEEERTWAMESLSAIMEVTGRTRHGRI